MPLLNRAITAIAVLASALPSLADEAILSQNQIKALQEMSADPRARQAALLILQGKVGPVQQPARTPAPAVKVPPAPAPTPAAPDPITALLTKNENKPPDQRQYSQCPGFNLLLRKDWSDTGIIAGSQCPQTVDKATGALVSFTDDRVANNKTVVMDGTAAFIYNSVTGDVPGQITPYETSFGVYTTANQSFNSAAAQAKSNIDTLAYGGVFEVGFSNAQGANYFRIRGGSVEDQLKDTTASNAAFEWLPVYNPLFIHVPVIQPFGLPLITRFDPAVAALFDEAVGKKQLLAFNNRSDSLRLGPELALNIVPFPGGPSWLANFNANIAYDWFYEAYSGASLNWFTGSLTYNIDKAGHIGLTGTYKTGRDVTSGQKADVYTVGLSGKI